MIEQGGDAGKRDAATRRRGDAATKKASDHLEVGGETPAAPAQPLLYPADQVVIAYITIITVLVVGFSFRIPLWPLFIALHALAIGLVLLLAKGDQSLSRRVAASPRRRVAASSFIHGWYPVALIPATYKELSYLIPLIHPRDFDAELAAIDHRLFGAHPTVWLERFTWPALTEILQLAYATYYFLPLILGVVLWRKQWFEPFRFWVFIVALGFYVSYLGYIAVPATGPRFLPAIKAAQSFPLSGVWLFHSLRDTLDRAEGITRDCFPSGHTELTLLVLYYARRFHRRTFWLMLPVGSALIMATVYLRYHYVVDVLAGGAAAALVILIAGPLYRILEGQGARGWGLEKRG
ncbi:MAG TPA: phosphatase PAP2 family protein [Blastocatellia bacterium]|nr:phosphatase PAP2 family protein [Blastocatellia bacterium]